MQPLFNLLSGVITERKVQLPCAAVWGGSNHLVPFHSPSHSGAQVGVFPGIVSFSSPSTSRSKSSPRRSGRLGEWSVHLVITMRVYPYLRVAWLQVRQ